MTPLGWLGRKTSNKQTNKYPKHNISWSIKYNVLAYFWLTVTSWTKVSCQSNYHYNDFVAVSNVGIKRVDCMRYQFAGSQEILGPDQKLSTQHTKENKCHFKRIPTGRTGDFWAICERRGDLSQSLSTRDKTVETSNFSVKKPIGWWPLTRWSPFSVMQEP